MQRQKMLRVLLEARITDSFEELATGMAKLLHRLQKAASAKKAISVKQVNCHGATCRPSRAAQIQLKSAMETIANIGQSQLVSLQVLPPRASQLSMHNTLQCEKLILTLELLQLEVHAIAKEAQQRATCANQACFHGAMSHSRKVVAMRLKSVKAAFASIGQRLHAKALRLQQLMKAMDMEQKVMEMEQMAMDTDTAMAMAMGMAMGMEQNQQHADAKVVLNQETPAQQLINGATFHPKMPVQILSWVSAKATIHAPTGLKQHALHHRMYISLISKLQGKQSQV
jgi:hypothetical protein